MAMTTPTPAADQTADRRFAVTAGNHPLAFVLLLIDHDVRRRREQAARRQRRQFRRRRPRLMLIQ